MEDKEYKCYKCNALTKDIIFYYAYATPNSSKDDENVLKFCESCYKDWLNNIG